MTRVIALLLAVAAVYAVFVASTKDNAQKQAGVAGKGSGKRGAGGGDTPVPVIGSEAKTADIPVYLEGVGTARALNTVTVRPQVDGKILKVHFKEGQSIKKGDLLIEIDPITYKAQLDQAKAKRALTETQLANAKRDADRFARIPGVVAQKTVDTQAALVAQFEAQVQADSAAVASAQAVLDYTRVLAPISGRTGLRQVDEGNIVRAGADTGIVTITQVQPISVLFNLPQQQLQAINRAMAAGVVAAEALDADGKTALDRGALQVVDNQVDQTTGTVRMKADFPNADLQLWPGQFVNVRLLTETLKQVVVVPTPAVQRGPNGIFVYVVNAEDRVALRPITLTQQTDTETVIKTGLQTGERIITSGFSRLQDGARVIFGRQGGEPPAQRTPTAAAGGGAGGDPDARARLEKFRQVCGPDLQTHCPGIPREELRQCIETNKAKFTAPCQAAVTERDANRASEGKGVGSGAGTGEGKRERGKSTSGATTGVATDAAAKQATPKSAQQ